MKKFQGFVKNFVQVATLLVTGSILAASPSQAATFASSNGALEFTNFSQSPLNVGTGTNVNTLAQGGIVQAQATAQAFFVINPPVAFNLSLTEAIGQGRDYLGLAESEARVIGDFVVEASTSFAFDFTAALDLNTFIENPPAENARAAGDISFVLFDRTNQNVLDFFSLTGNLTTEGDNDFIALQKSDNVAFNVLAQDSQFGGNFEFANALVQGSLERFFANKTDLTLIEVKTNKAQVQAPEPSTTLALFLGCGVVGIAAVRRKK
ncbi:PEP-CTERM sorting domain-containing protein [Iningainema tapete]|uniref:PEP-CTERM sorting domain-containing protein n=1 Tax=Iningainema tapete BLCC-T55 TaxID=2748662 RepID=A0A8J6XDZ7_9CYAN|nr:PEP-CTERM sorting domain-containing protein [Iningainema tapete]MBD2773634.1 PEP-CTERM sorting domain-containing protein [Iningainema tapete BLCC-T55]